MLQTIKDAFLYLLHFTDHLPAVINSMGPLATYGILFLIIFCETGLVVLPFLPGDSLLFITGFLSADPKTGMNVHLCAAILVTGAIIGDTVNYHIGKYLGPKVLKNENSRIFKKKYLDMTHGYFERYGARTIIVARFVPIVRTFAPFIAGVGAMSYRQFIIYNIVGAFVWVYSLTYAGYLFSNVPFVKENRSKIVWAIVIISVLPMVYEFVRLYFAGPPKPSQTPETLGSQPPETRPPEK
jgi:membrane-associated protein